MDGPFEIEQVTARYADSDESTAKPHNPKEAIRGALWLMEDIGREIPANPLLDARLRLAIAMLSNALLEL